jgi:Tol biopolymer transport system component
MRNGDVWTIGSSGESPSVLNAKPGFWTISPVWSPDGKKVAFIRQEVKQKGLPASTIQVAGANGGSVQAVVTESANAGYLSWAPDSKRLAYTTARAIRVVEVDEGEARDLIWSEEGDYLAGGLDWTRDGRSIVYGFKEDQLDLWVYSFDSSQSRRLTKGGGIMPHVSPDGKKVVYRDPTGETGIWVVPIEGGEPTLLLRDEKRKLYFHPRWSPDGLKIAVSALTIKDSGMTSAIWVFSP